MSSEAKILISNREFCSEILKAPNVKKFEMDKTDSVWKEVAHYRG